MQDKNKHKNCGHSETFNETCEQFQAITSCSHENYIEGCEGCEVKLEAKRLIAQDKAQD